MKLLDDYLSLKQQIFNYFGYVEGWCVIPIEDGRKYHWRLYGTGPGSVRFAETEELLDDLEQHYFEHEIYMQKVLPQWVYRGAEYTIVCVDTHTDGNKFLMIFDNAKEHK